jgi:hypothetical protein
MQPTMAAVRNKLARAQAWVMALFLTLSMALRRFGAATRANALGVGILGVLLTIVGGIVVFIVLGEMVTPFFDALGAFLSALTLVEIGESTAANVTEVIISSLAILVGVGGALFIVGYGLRAAGVGRKG